MFSRFSVQRISLSYVLCTLTATYEMHNLSFLVLQTVKLRVDHSWPMWWLHFTSFSPWMILFSFCGVVLKAIWGWVHVWRML